MQNPQKKRISAIRHRLDKEPFDTLLVLEQENRKYLSGFTGEDGQCDESAGALFITADRQLLATDSRYVTQAENEAPEFEVFCYTRGLSHSLPDILQSLGTKHLGFEAVRVSYLQYKQFLENLEKKNPDVSIHPSKGLVEELRVMKDETEIALIKRSLSLAESVFLAVTASLTPGMKEKDLAWAVERGLREGGAEAIAFPPIVAAGPNAALPHAIPTDRPVQEGEPLLFDWGARLNGYCSDISRTIVLGKPDETFSTVYQVVKDAQAMAIEGIKPGASTQDIDRIARDHITAKGFGDYFGHGLGHGVGLATHEKPHLSPLRPSRLELGMVTTVEPGIYLPEWGGVRLENMVVVREHGAEILNALPQSPFLSST